MVLNLILLFVAALGGGLVALSLPQYQSRAYKLSLVFAGSYLFAITIIHILPELFTTSDSPGQLGVFVLAGFFLQQILEYFTQGAEHGHVHIHEEHSHHSIRASLMLLLAMMFHSFLEGSLLAHPSTGHAHHDSMSLLVGIMLHKAPAAFALMSILLCSMSKSRALIYLVLFALASPLGLYVGDVYVENGMLSSDTFAILFALVCGNFLHISTTIVYESSVEHQFNARKLAVAIAGALIAVFAELLF